MLVYDASRRTVRRSHARRRRYGLGVERLLRTVYGALSTAERLLRGPRLVPVELRRDAVAAKREADGALAAPELTRDLLLSHPSLEIVLAQPVDVEEQREVPRLVLPPRQRPMASGALGRRRYSSPYLLLSCVGVMVQAS